MLSLSLSPPLPPTHLLSELQDGERVWLRGVHHPTPQQPQTMQREKLAQTCLVLCGLHWEGGGGGGRGGGGGSVCTDNKCTCIYSVRVQSKGRQVQSRQLVLERKHCIYHCIYKYMYIYHYTHTVLEHQMSHARHVTGTECIYLQHLQQHDSLPNTLCLQHDAGYGDHLICVAQSPARPDDVINLLLKL